MSSKRIENLVEEYVDKIFALFKIEDLKQIRVKNRKYIKPKIQSKLNEDIAYFFSNADGKISIDSNTGDKYYMYKIKKRDDQETSLWKINKHINGLGHNVAFDSCAQEIVETILNLDLNSKNYSQLIREIKELHFILIKQIYF